MVDRTVETMGALVNGIFIGWGVGVLCMAFFA